ncbi:hypothetical protein GGI00_006526, partial [Coemansia sp. RSA 2681]
SGIANAIATTRSTSATQSPLVSQLARLASWYQTIWYVEEAASDWNNSATYVDLWAAVCHRAAALKHNTDDPRDWRVSCDEWSEADRLLLDDTEQQVLAGDDNDWLDGGIWERSIGTLRELKQRVLDIIGRAISKDVVGQLRAYRKKSNWAVEGIDAGADIGVSIELGGLLPELSSVVIALEAMVPSWAFTRLLRQLAAELDTFLIERVAFAHSFSQSGGRQFARDVGALTAADDMVLSLDEWGPTVTDPTASDRETELMLKKLGINHLSAKEARLLVGLRVDFAELTGCND